MGVVLEALGQGLRVPDDLSIVGYVDVEIMKELPVPITTLRVQSAEVGRRAVMLLIDAVHGRPSAVERECDVEIVKRASSGPVPIGPTQSCPPAPAVSGAPRL